MKPPDIVLVTALLGLLQIGQALPVLELRQNDELELELPTGAKKITVPDGEVMCAYPWGTVQVAHPSQITNYRNLTGLDASPSGIMWLSALLEKTRKQNVCATAAQWGKLSGMGWSLYKFTSNGTIGLVQQQQQQQTNTTQAASTPGSKYITYNVTSNTMVLIEGWKPLSVVEAARPLQIYLGQQMGYMRLKVARLPVPAGNKTVILPGIMQRLLFWGRRQLLVNAEDPLDFKIVGLGVPVAPKTMTGYIMALMQYISNLAVTAYQAADLAVADKNATMSWDLSPPPDPLKPQRRFVNTNTPEDVDIPSPTEEKPLQDRQVYISERPTPTPTRSSSPVIVTSVGYVNGHLTTVIYTASPLPTPQGGEGATSISSIVLTAAKNLPETASFNGQPVEPLGLADLGESDPSQSEAGDNTDSGSNEESESWYTSPLAEYGGTSIISIPS